MRTNWKKLAIKLADAFESRDGMDEIWVRNINRALNAVRKAQKRARIT